MILIVTQAFCNCKLKFFQLFSGLLLMLCQTRRHTSWSVEPDRSNLVCRTWFDHEGVTRTANAFSLCTSRAHDCVPSACTNQVRLTRLDQPGSTNQVRPTQVCPTRFDHPGPRLTWLGWVTRAARARTTLTGHAAGVPQNTKNSRFRICLRV